MVIWHLKQIGKIKKLDKWVPHELTTNQKNCHFEVWSSLVLHKKRTISWLDCDVWQKVDFNQQLAMTSSVVGLRRSSKALPKAKLAPKKGHGHCLVVCCQFDPLQLPETFASEKYAQQINEIHCKRQQLQPTLVNRKGPILLHDNTWLHITHECFKSRTKWATKFCLIHHIHLTSCQPTTTSSSISIPFCGKSTSTTSRMQKMFSKSSPNPKHGFLCYRNKPSYFSFAKICWLQ